MTEPTTYPTCRLSATLTALHQDAMGLPLRFPISVIRVTIDEGDGIDASYDLEPHKAMEFAAHLIRMAERETCNSDRMPRAVDVSAMRRSNPGDLMR